MSSAKVDPGRDRDQVATSSDVRQGYPTLKELKAMSREDFDARWRAVTASEDEFRGWMSRVGLKTLSELAPDER